MKPQRLTRLLATGALFAAIVTGQTVQAQSAARRPATAPTSPAKPRNVIFILLDDLRYDGMSRISLVRIGALIVRDPLLGTVTVTSRSATSRVSPCNCSSWAVESFWGIFISI